MRILPTLRRRTPHARPSARCRRTGTPRSCTRIDADPIHRPGILPELLCKAQPTGLGELVEQRRLIEASHHHDPIGHRPIGPEPTPASTVRLSGRTSR